MALKQTFNFRKNIKLCGSKKIHLFACSAQAETLVIYDNRAFQALHPGQKQCLQNSGSA
jgi:hypothetical protein